MPQVVRNNPHDSHESSEDAPMKGVVYQDLIAVLTAAVQEQQAVMESRWRKQRESTKTIWEELLVTRRDLAESRSDVAALAARLSKVEEKCCK